MYKMKKIIYSIFLICLILFCFHCATKNKNKIDLAYNYIVSRLFDLETRGQDTDNLDKKLDQCRAHLQSKKYNEAETCLDLLAKSVEEEYHRMFPQEYVYDNVVFQDIIVEISWGKNIGFVAYPSKQGKYPGLIFLRWAASKAVDLKRVIYAYAKKNYICLAPEFNDLDFGKGTEDLKKWYDLFKSHPYLDSQHLGIVSYSRGGYYAYQLIERKVPFQAWVNYFGVVHSNMVKSAVIRRNPVPALILHGKRDRICPVQWAYVLEKAYREARVPCQIKIFSQEGHGFREEAREQATAMTEEFLSQYLKESGQF